MGKEERSTYTIKMDANLGEVKIADEVVAIIAGLAAMEVEGVASMAGNATRELISKLGMKSLSKGVRVDVLEGIVTVMMALNLKYGYNIKSTTAKVQEKVKTALKLTLESGVPQQKRKQTCLEKYGVDHPAKMADHLRKCNRTKFLNNTFHTSKPEEDAYKILIEKFGSEYVLRQYRSEVYPFNCDFYIKSLDLYIECQFSHFHYKEPFDMNKLDHLKRLEDLKRKELEHRSKQKSVYTSMIHTWTESDPLKRKTAKENNLNWIEFFNMKELKDELQQLYLKTN
jgi:uncharacterized alkaline shock family protein YloU